MTSYVLGVIAAAVVVLLAHAATTDTPNTGHVPVVDNSSNPTTDPTTTPTVITHTTADNNKNNNASPTSKTTIDTDTTADNNTNNNNASPTSKTTINTDTTTDNNTNNNNYNNNNNASPNSKTTTNTDTTADNNNNNNNNNASPTSKTTINTTTVPAPPAFKQTRDLRPEITTINTETTADDNNNNNVSPTPPPTTSPPTTTTTSPTTTTTTVSTFKLTRDSRPEDAWCSKTPEDYKLQTVQAQLSCRGRCGVARDSPCSCDPLCTVYGHCCHDFTLQCPDVQPSLPMADIASVGHETNSYIDDDDDADREGDVNNGDGDRIVGEDDAEEVSRRSLSVAECTRVHARLVDTCPPSAGPVGPQADSVEAKCQTGDYSTVSGIADVLPVTDLTTGLQYKNVYCLMCNGGEPEKSVAWDLKVVPDRASSKIDVHSLDDVLKGVKMNSTRLFALPRQGIQRVCVPDGLTKEVPSYPCKCSKLKKLCYEEPDNVLLLKETLFKNMHCLLCFLASIRSRSLSLQIRVPTIQNIMEIQRTRGLDIVMKVVGKDDQHPSTGADVLQTGTSSSESHLSFESSGAYAWTRMKCYPSRATGGDPVRESHSPPLTDQLEPPGLGEGLDHEETGTDARLDHNVPPTTTATPPPNESAWIHRSSFTADPQRVQSLLTSDTLNTMSDGFSCTYVSCRRNTYDFQGYCLAAVRAIRVVVSYLHDDRFARFLRSGPLGRPLVKILSLSLRQTLKNVDLYNFTVLAAQSVHDERRRMINHTIYVKDFTQPSDIYYKVTPLQEALRQTAVETLVNFSEQQARLEICIGFFLGQVSDSSSFPGCPIDFHIKPIIEPSKTTGQASGPAGHFGVIWAMFGLYILLC